MQDLAFPGADLNGHPLTMGVLRSSDLTSLLAFTNKVVPSLSIGEAQWRALIAAEYLVCARTPTGDIVGLYAANHLAFDGSTHGTELRAVLNVLCNRFKLDEHTVAFGAVAAVDPRFGASSLRLHLLRALLRTVGLRCRHLFTFVNKNDLFEMNALPSEGWRCFFEEDDTCYMALNVSRTLRQLPSRLMLGLPPTAEKSLSRPIHS